VVSGHLQTTPLLAAAAAAAAGGGADAVDTEFYAV